MGNLTITAAAKLVGMSRQHLHRAYIKPGTLSVSRDREGHPFIDPSELVRVFGDRVKGDTELRTETESMLRTVPKHGDHATQESVTETAVLSAKVTALQQACEDLRHDKRRLEGQVDRLQALLEHRPATAPAENPAAVAQVAELSAKLTEQEATLAAERTRAAELAADREKIVAVTAATIEAERIRTQELQAALEAERSKGFFARLFKR